MPPGSKKPDGNWNNWTKLEVFLFVGSGLAVLAGNQFGIPMLISIGIGVIGFDVALFGLQAIVTRKMNWGVPRQYTETYQGIAAMSLGLIMVIAGLGIGAMAIAQALDREESFIELLFSRPGFVLLLIGGVMLLRGLAGVIGALEWNESALAGFGAIFQRLGGLLLASLGSAFLLLGALDVIAPAVFQQLISTGWQILLRIW